MKFQLRTLYSLIALLLFVCVQQSFSYIPSRQAKAIVFTNIDANQASFRWVNGNGSNSIVLVRATTLPDVSGIGDGMSTATANADFSSASEYLSTGAKLVYAGTSNSVTVTGLTANTTYKVIVLSYNVDGGTWDVNPSQIALLNPRSFTTLQSLLGVPATLTNTAITATTATVSWGHATNATGYYLDVRLFGGAILAEYDLLDIGLNDENSPTFYITGLTANTSYQWRLRAYDAQGRVGAATAWVSLSTTALDPTVAMSGAGSACSNTADLVAAWNVGTASYSMNGEPPTNTNDTASGVWSTLIKPSGASEPVIYDTLLFSGSSTGQVTVDTPGAYVFEYTINVGEYESSNTVGYTFNAPVVDITNTETSTCGTYYALSATTTGCNAGVGTWSVTTPLGGTGSFGNATSLNTEYTLTGSPVYGDYTFHWTSTLGGFTDTDDIVVTFDQIPSASFDPGTSDACGLTYTLAGNQPISGATGSWTYTGPGTASFVSATSYNSSVDVTEQGEYSFTWTVSNTCATFSDYANITFYHEPTVAAAGSDDEACGTSYTLAGNTATYGVGNWTAPLGVVFDDATTSTSGVTIPTFAGSSTAYTFTWTIANGACVPSSDDVTVTFYNQPTASITSPSAAICGLGITNLDGNNSAIGTGSWTYTSEAGTASFGSVSSYNSSVEVTAEGEYTFTWTVSNGTCTPATATKTVTFYHELTEANAGNDGEACGTYYTLAGNTALYGAGTWTGPLGTSFSNNTVPTSGVSIPTFAGSSTAYTFTWSIGNGICENNYDDVTVTFYNSPSSSNAGDDYSACGTLTGTLAGNNPSVGTGSWTLVGGAGTVSFDDASSNTSTFNASAYGTYTFAWTISNGTCTPTSDQVVYNFYQTPTADAGDNFAVCGPDATLGATNPSVGTGSWSSNGSVTFVNSTSYNTVATAIEPGTYTLTWTVSNGTCDPVTSEVTVTYKEEVDADAGDDGIACISTYYTMDAGLNLDETGTWSQSGDNPGTASFSDIYNPESNVWFTEPGVYEFTWTVSNGTCNDAAAVSISVHEPITIPLGAEITGVGMPIAGVSGYQYSIPNYDDELTYSWYYEASNETCTYMPTLHNITSNVITVDYPMDACDGTLYVVLTDLCGNASSVYMDVDVQNNPAILTSSFPNTNEYIEFTTNMQIYSNCNSTDPVVPSDFQVIFEQNGGTATAVTITSITEIDDTHYKFNLSITGTPNGCETIEIKPVSNSVFAPGEVCNPMLTDQTTGVYHLYNKTDLGAATNVTPTTYARSADITWTAPAGTKSLVVVSCSTSFVDPSNYTEYLADANYGTQTYTPGTGYAVYNGTGNSVTVTGLTPETTYYVAVWSYTEACGTNNEFYNSSEATATCTTKVQATKLVAITPPTQVSSGVAFNVTVQAQDDNGNPAYPGCDETLTIESATATLPANATQVTISNVIYTNNSGECEHSFTIDDNSACSYDLAAATFVADVAPSAPTTQARTMVFMGIQKNQVTVRWTNGNGTGRMLAGRVGSSSIPKTAFVNGTDYSAVTTSSPSNFNNGFDMGNSGTKGLFVSTSSTNQVTVDNLTTGTTYNFRVVEFNKPDCDDDWSLANFNSPNSASLNPRSITTSSKFGSFNGVEISYFNGKSIQAQVNLNWEAISEDGITHYEIYRQGINDENMTKVISSNVKTSAGFTNQYSVNDNKGLILGQTYIYRLVGVDVNGQSTDLAETMVTVNDDVNTAANLILSTVNPNPVKDVVKFDVTTSRLSNVLIEIRNLDGQVIYSEERMINGVNTIEYKMNNKAAGSYYITVTSGDEGSFTSFIFQP